MLSNHAQRLLFAGLLVLLACSAARGESAPSFADVADAVQPKIVKIYGAGGLRGLEAYQSGFLISADGHLLTAWSYVLDSDVVTVTLSDGRKFEAELVGADPRTEIAVLKIDAEDLPYFELEGAQAAPRGTRVLAFSNLFGVATGNEAASVLHGLVAARTSLHARRGAYATPYRGSVYVLDAITNNPGAAGGALTNRAGELLGMLGKELRNSFNNTWLNYAIPIGELASTVEGIRAGKVPSEPDEASSKPSHPFALDAVGIVLVPDVLERTPPFIDAVRSGSPAAAAGLRSDDLVILINQRLAQSCKALLREIAQIEYDATIQLTVMREQELVEVTLAAPINTQ